MGLATRGWAGLCLGGRPRPARAYPSACGVVHSRVDLTTPETATLAGLPDSDRFWLVALAPAPVATGSAVTPSWPRWSRSLLDRGREGGPDRPGATSTPRFWWWAIRFRQREIVSPPP